MWNGGGRAGVLVLRVGLGSMALAEVLVVRGSGLFLLDVSALGVWACFDLIFRFEISDGSDHIV